MIEKLLKIYDRVITQEFVRKVLSCAGVVEREGIYQSSIVLWLMLFQRLRRGGTLVEAVENLRCGESSELLRGRAQGSIRARTGRISGFTGGYAQARERLPIELVRSAIDAISAEIIESVKSSDEVSKRVYVIDGSTIRTSYTESNTQAFPQYKNQYGQAHFPIVRVLVATNAISGVAVAPAYGAFNGKDAVGETTLASQVLAKLPQASVVIGDRLYGTASFAIQAKQNGHKVICRVKEHNAKNFISRTPCGEVGVTWKSKKNEEIDGRFIWETIKVPGEKPFRLILFTTEASFTRKQLVQLYSLRWNVELDLRDIKSTLEMDSIDTKTPEMFEKELLTGITAYNLIRHAFVQVGNACKIPYRRFSFSRMLARVQALEGKILSTSFSKEAKNDTFDRAMCDYQSLLLPVRKRRRPNEPRKVWPKGTLHTMRGSRELERKKLKE